MYFYVDYVEVDVVTYGDFLAAVVTDAAAIQVLCNYYPPARGYYVFTLVAVGSIMSVRPCVCVCVCPSVPLS